MNEEGPWRRLLEDPLKEVTRKERRALLAVSIAALIVAKTGIPPLKLLGTGVEFLPSDKESLLLIFAAVVAYFLFAFIVYATSDFIIWQRTYYDLIERLKFEETERQYKAEQEGATNVVIGFEALNTRREAWRSFLRQAGAPTSVARALFEFLLPIAVGLIALVSLLMGAAK